VSVKVFLNRFEHKCGRIICKFIDFNYEAKEFNEFHCFNWFFGNLINFSHNFFKNSKVIM
jgi:hypothetical protein